MRWSLLLLSLLLGCAQSGPNGPDAGGARRTTRILVVPPTAADTGSSPGPDDAFPIPGVPSTGPDGPYEQRDGGALLVKGAYEGGRPVGVWTGWHRGGAKKVEGKLEGGVPVGEWRVWYADGTTREVSRYSGGEPAGTWTLHYPGGGLFEEMQHEDGEPHGSWKIFHPNGQVADEMTWAVGLQTGTETSWSPEGRRVGVGTFDAGRPAGAWTCFDLDGTERALPPPPRATTPRQACTTDPGPDLGPMPGAGADEQFVTRNPKLEDR